MFLVFVTVGLNLFSTIGFEVHAQTSSSCDGDVSSLVDCSPSTSSSPSSGIASVSDDSDKNDNNDDDNDNSDNSEDQKEEKKAVTLSQRFPLLQEGVFPFP